MRIKADDVFENLGIDETIELELTYGNSEKIALQRILDKAGPFRVKTPWTLEDNNGQTLIHAGGFSAMPLGEHHPKLIDFVKDYFEKNKEVAFPQQLAATWRAALEHNLVQLVSENAPNPEGHKDSQVFFSSGGAEAIESAIKFVKAARPKATYLINFTGGYHGKTTGALSITPSRLYQEPFEPLLPNVITLPFGDLQALEDLIFRVSADKIAGIFLEPIQGEAGVIIPPEGFLQGIEAIRQRYGIIVVADEIQTGLGRSGYWFASLANGLDADIITLAKGLSGGLVPVGATIARKWIMQRTFEGGGAKQHSNTFGGGSLAMAVALKTIEIVEEENLVERSYQLGKKGLEKLKVIEAKYPGFVSDVRGSGMLFALDLKHVLPTGVARTELLKMLASGFGMKALQDAGIYGVYSLNAKNSVRLSPPLNIPEELFEELFANVETVAERYPQAWMMLVKKIPTLNSTDIKTILQHVFK